MAPRISIVVPVYRAERMLPELYGRIVNAVEQIDPEFELILVDDCGGDNSWQVIEELSISDARVLGIRLSRNYGQHNALLAGIRAVRGELTVTMDDDLQHPPEELSNLLAKLTEGYDVVYGTPTRPQHGPLRNWASRITKATLKGAMGADTAGHVSAFRVFRTELRRAFADYRSPMVNIDVLLTWATNRFAVAPVRHDPRSHGASGYTVRRLFNHAFNMMTGFSATPLQLASVLGFAFALFGFGILAYVVAAYFIQGESVPGFPFLASIIAIFSGAQLFALGIIGEYLARMHFRTMDKPAYTIRAFTNTSKL